MQTGGRWRTRVLSLQPLEERWALTVEFARHDVLEMVGTQSIVPADLDGDGDQDLLVTSVNAFGIAWLENLDGRGGFDPRPRLIESRIDGARLGLAVDLDGDRDLDVVVARGSRGIGWYENLGTGEFSEQRRVGVGGVDAVIEDMDQDGDLDLVTAWYAGSDEAVYQLLWYENTDGRGAFRGHVVEERLDPQLRGGNSVTVGDFDGDGDFDIAALTQRTAGTLSWYRNVDGKGSFGAAQVVSDRVAVGRAVVASDLDGDGDVDLIVAARPAGGTSL